MSRNENDGFFLKKAYEVSYAIFRISPYIGNPGLKEKLELRALSLIDAMSMQDYERASLATRSIEYLVRFGGDAGLINLMNTETMIVQINVLNTAIAESGNAATPKEVPLDGIFSEANIETKSERKKEPKVEQKAEARNEDDGAYYQPVIKPIPVTEEEVAASSNEDTATEHISGGVFKAAMRQSAILDRIRQSGNCRLKDIQEVLPDASERTIRYDLQSLMEQNLVERIGNGGPSVYYRVRQDAVR